MSFDITAEYAKACTGKRLTWNEAVTAMQGGAVVRRARDMFIKTLEASDNLNEAIIDSGMEATRLHVAVTDTGDFVHVFYGACSRCLYEPDDEVKASDDWIVLDDKRLW